MEFYRLRTQQDALDFIKILPEVVAIDTEFVKGDPRTTTLLSIIVADADRAWEFPPSLLPTLSAALQTRKLIFLQDYNHCDTIILLKNGCDLRRSNTHNLIDMHHLLDENADHSLGSRVLDVYKDNYKKEFWAQFKHFEDAPEHLGLEYSCKDAIYTYRLGLEDLRKITFQPVSSLIGGPDRNLFLNLYNHVRELSSALLGTQLTGLNVNTKLMEDTKEQIGKQIEDYSTKLRKEFSLECETWELEEWSKQISKRTSEAGRLRCERPTFSFSSDKQVSWLVYEALKLPVITRTKKRNPATDLETLRALEESEPRLKLLTEFKDVKSLYATFIEGMLERVENDRIYPSFNVSGTSTGRLSHSNPNMGNLPKSDIIRNFFIPSEGMVFIGADYSQLEVVIEANLTDDPQLLKIINEGVSKHDITAEGLGIDRDKAKTLNFALQYGAGSSKVAKILGIPNQDAENIFKRYWDLYSGVRTLKEKTSKEIKETGQVTNLAGRTRHFPKPLNKYEGFRQERQAYNFLIQGLAAECCNRAFYRMGEFLNGHDGQALFSVHDEILCEVGNKSVESCKKALVTIMEQSSEDFNFKYPLKAVSYGPLDMWGKT